MDLVFFGIQGSGKGTQAKRLAEEFGYSIFEAGGELRRIAASGSNLGNTVKEYIDAGKLVPHEIIMKVVAAAVDERDADTAILFDGIPRDMDQKRDFDTVMEQAGREFTCLHILLDKQEAIRRITQRAEEEGRIDDANPAIVAKRMETFFEKTEPVIAEYKAAGKVEEVNGDGTMEEVYQRIVSTLHLSA